MCAHAYIRIHKKTSKGDYIAEINSWILQSMYNDEYRVKNETYKEIYEQNKAFYLTYDYEKIFEK